MRVIIVCVAALFGVVSAPLTATAGANPAAPWGYGGGTATTPAPHPMTLAPRAQEAPAGAHLTYLGGPVISNVSVQSVYWGAGSYEPNAGPGETPMTEFFQGVTDSPYLDWLAEYNTANQVDRLGVPPQTIGRGRYQGQATISVSPANRGTTDTDGSRRVSDENIQSELEHQLTSGALPPPQLDAAGQVTTLYAMFLPDTVTVTIGTSVGGEPGGFCAYHSTILHDGLAVPYMVLPDFQTHHFAQGCGSDPNSLFNNFTAVTAHELVESITDPAVGVGAASWIDINSGLEIADICQFITSPQGPVTGGNGLSLVVQNEFSNAANDCVITRKGPAPSRKGYVDACGLASRTGFPDAGLAADCLKQYGIAQGKNDGTFGENDGLVRSQVSSLLARIIDASGETLTQTRTFPDVNADTVPNAQVRSEIELLAGAGIIAGFPDGLFHPTDNLSVPQAAALVLRTLQFVHGANSSAPDIVDQGSTAADYQTAANLGLLDTSATNIRGFDYAAGSGDTTDRGLLADVLAQAIQQLVTKGVVNRL